MAVILEVKVGPMSGEKIVIRTGESVTFGRVGTRAKFALPHDTVMSGLHFSVECGPQGPFVKDQNSTNGTYLNGARVKESALTNGDEIRTGQTTFSVRLIADEKLAQGSAGAGPSAPPPRPVVPAPQPPPSSSPSAEQRATARPQPEIPPPPRPQPPPQAQPSAQPAAQAPVAAPPAPPSRPAPPPEQQPAPSPAPPRVSTPPPAPKPQPPRPAAVALSGKPSLLSVGSWGFSVVPQGWTSNEFGLERDAKDDRFPSSVTATEEMLAGNPALGPFVESQLSMLRQYLRAPRIEAAIPPAIPGAEEKASVDVRYSTNDGQTIFYRRLYARSGNTVGTVTLMTLDSEFPSIRPAFEAIVGGIAFQVKPPA